MKKVAFVFIKTCILLTILLLVSCTNVTGADDNSFSSRSVTDAGISPGGPPRLLWNKTYEEVEGGGWMVGQSLVQVADGGYALVGSYPHACLIRTDSSGNMMWNRTYDGSVCSLACTKDGGFALAGYDYNDVLLLKTNSNGDMIWNKTYGGTEEDEAYAVIQTTDGGFALAGCTYSFGTPGADAYLIKTDADGNLLWNRTYQGGINSGFRRAYSLVQTADGGFALATSVPSYSHAQGCLIRTDSEGIKLWSRNCFWNPLEGCEVYSIIIANDGGYALIGCTTCNSGTDSMMCIFKIDDLGNNQWVELLDTEGYLAAGRSLIQTEYGYMVVGDAETGSGRVACLVGTSGTGVKGWEFSYDKTARYGYCLIHADDGGYTMLGTAQNGELYLAKSSYSDVPQFSFTSLMLIMVFASLLLVVYRSRRKHR